MSLFPDEDILTKEIATWKGFADKLPNEESDVYKIAIIAKGLPVSDKTVDHGPVIKLIEWSMPSSMTNCNSDISTI